jgi:hypothetical protein
MSDSLPKEIWAQIIFPFLEPGYLCVTRLVCKFWCELIEKSQTHTNRDDKNTTSCVAARDGYLELLIYANEKGCPCYMYDISQFAAANGHIHILECLCSRDAQMIVNAWSVMNAQTFSVAAENNQIKTVNWLTEQKCPWDINSFCLAAEHGHLKILKILKKRAMFYKIVSSDLRQIGKWGKGVVFEWKKCICNAAAKGGQIRILKWLRSQNPPCPWNQATCGYAARSGDIETLKWLRSQDPPCPWDSNTCAYAASNGHLETLKWLRDKSDDDIYGRPCPWNMYTIHRANQREHQEVEEWARENGCGFADQLTGFDF